MSGAITATTVAVAAMSTAEIFTAVAITGAVVGAVGAVTGIKPLQYAGMALGAIGGIGALAVSAGVIGGEALTAGAGLADAGGLASDGGFAGAVGSDVAAGGLGDAVAAAGPTTAFDVTPDFIDSMTGQVNLDAVNPASGLGSSPLPDVTPEAAIDTGVPDGTGALDAPPDLKDASGGLTASDKVLHDEALNKALDQAAGPGLVDQPTAPAVQTPGAPAAPQATATTNGIQTGGGTVTGAPTYGQVGSIVGPTPKYNSITDLLASGNANDPSVFSNVMDVLGKPGVGTLAAGAIQAGASFVAGATSSLTPAQVNALNAQAAANQAAANLSTRQQANMASGIPVASRPGLVNSPNVTGAPA